MLNLNDVRKYADEVKTKLVTRDSKYYVEVDRVLELIDDCRKLQSQVDLCRHFEKMKARLIGTFLTAKDDKVLHQAIMQYCEAYEVLELTQKGYSPNEIVLIQVLVSMADDSENQMAKTI